jgi:site-specific DNA methylase
VAAPRGSKTGTQGLKGARERSVIPQKLCDHIVDICEE